MLWLWIYAVLQNIGECLKFTVLLDVCFLYGFFQCVYYFEWQAQAPVTRLQPKQPWCGEPAHYSSYFVWVAATPHIWHNWWWCTFSRQCTFLDSNWCWCWLMVIDVDWCWLMLIARIFVANLHTVLANIHRPKNVVAYKNYKMTSMRYGLAARSARAWSPSKRFFEASKGNVRWRSCSISDGALVQSLYNWGDHSNPCASRILVKLGQCGTIGPQQDIHLFVQRRIYF